ncbi:MAG: TRAP transporter small permease [Alphaproteobacteria bacterium]
MLRSLALGYGRLIEGLALLGAFGLGAMALWITYDVAARYLLAAPTIWAGDLAEYVLFVATFLGGPWLVRRNGHIAVDLAVEKLPPRTRKALQRAVLAIAAVACAVFAWFALAKTLHFHATGRLSPKSWEIPLWLPYSAMPAGAALMAIECLRHALIGGAPGDARAAESALS